MGNAGKGMLFNRECRVTTEGVRDLNVCMSRSDSDNRMMISEIPCTKEARGGGVGVRELGRKMQKMDVKIIAQKMTYNVQLQDARCRIERQFKRSTLYDSRKVNAVSDEVA
ncbi:hypothetical protein ACMFMF_011948 [Clarireedia jacksonii]